MKTSEYALGLPSQVGERQRRAATSQSERNNRSSTLRPALRNQRGSAPLVRKIDGSQQRENERPSFRRGSVQGVDCSVEDLEVRYKEIEKAIGALERGVNDLHKISER